MSANYKQVICDVVQSELFIKAVFSGGSKQVKKVMIRPVTIKGEQYLQFSYFDSKKDITKNYTSEESIQKLHQVFLQKFTNITVQTVSKTIQVELPAHGKARIHEHNIQPVASPDTSHDRKKELILSPTVSLPFLQKLGIMNLDGTIATNKQSKFHQINQFLKVIEQSGLPRSARNDVLKIVDFGCGSGYLTFAVYYYFCELLKRSTEMIGVDVNIELIKKLSQDTQDLHWENIYFQTNTIKHFVPEQNADMVIALHACDTATDDALFQAIRMNSTYIFSSPCCHHNLQEQLNKAITPGIFHPVFRYAILGERMGDILTDTFRGLILQIMGYKTDIIEFTSQEHTSKNLLIRAIKSDTLQTQKYIHEYKTLKKYWKVTPYLETLLGKSFTYLL